MKKLFDLISVIGSDTLPFYILDQIFLPIKELTSIFHYYSRLLLATCYNSKLLTNDFLQINAIKENPKECRILTGAAFHCNRPNF